MTRFFIRWLQYWFVPGTIVVITCLVFNVFIVITIVTTDPIGYYIPLVNGWKSSAPWCLVRKKDVLLFLDAVVFGSSETFYFGRRE